jgi:hypothetical protein
MIDPEYLLINEVKPIHLCSSTYHTEYERHRKRTFLR